MSEPVVALDRKQQYAGFIERKTTEIIAALPISVQDKDLKRARAQFRVAFSSDAQQALVECTPDSIARALVLSAITGLMPGGPKPDVWLIPRRNKHKQNALECNWQISYRGYIRLARRAGWDIEPVLVFEGEDFRVEEGNVPKVHHVRNLDVDQTWETIRYGYIRVFREGQRANAKIAYLTKAQIAQRRAKAQDLNIWNEWPLEQSLKTLCNYAGNREMFPLDDPSRYAIESSDQAEIGGMASPLPLGAASAPQSLAPAAREADTITLTPEYAPEPAQELQGGDRELGQSVEEPVADLRAQIQTLLLEQVPGDPNDKNVKAAKKEALEQAFGTGSWQQIATMGPNELRGGLEGLRGHFERLAELRRLAERREEE